jgi:dienelactone hydrolase
MSRASEILEMCEDHAMAGYYVAVPDHGSYHRTSGPYANFADANAVSVVDGSLVLYTGDGDNWFVADDDQTIEPFDGDIV